uniref:Rho GTPase-activating protein 26 n=1 Tax=Timema bartmani TaxID=61472 RepID=A0A7R9HYQ2_9NEOP|nr:unnamed protein product [Timema bartmani]
MFDVTGMFSWVSDQDTAVGEEKHAHDETNQDEHHHSKKQEDQKTRDNFNATRDITESYMRKMLEVRPMKSTETGSPHRNSDREGYLFLMEKKAFGTTWTKQYCTYHKNSKEFRMIPYNQMTGKFSSAESFTLASCVRRMSDSIEKRFCFDITSVESAQLLIVVFSRPGVVAVQYTLQALSEEDRKQWMDIMDGKEPVSEGLHASALHGMYAMPGKIPKPEERALDEIGIGFVNRCIEVLESRGLEEQGLYRVAGVSSKVTKLVSMGLDRRKSDKMTMLDDSYEWDSKTITSALKTYLRNLPEPLMTFRYHNGFIAAAKLESRSQRVNDVHTLIHRLPQQNMEVLDILLRHLNNVASKSDRNLMTVSNLGVCFGPTLLRPEEETVAAIMDIKFCNIVVEILIENYDKIFKTKPEQMELSRPENQTSPQSLALGMNHVGSSPPPPSHPRKMHYGTGSQPITHAVTKAYEGPVPVNLTSSLHSLAASSREPGNGVGYLHGPNNYPGPRPPPALSEINLLTAGYQGHTMYPRLQAGLLQDNHGGSDRTYDQYSNSSSNESVSSLPSKDSVNHNSYGVISPQKNKRGAMVGLHYASLYRTPDTSVASGCSSTTGSGRSSPASPSVRRVRTLYACMGENDGELSFEPNQIITNGEYRNTNVRPSKEPGWLEGTLNGKTGLVPENYVEFLP